MSFRIKIKQDDQVIARAKGENIDDFDNIMKDLKIKFNGRRK